MSDADRTEFLGQPLVSSRPFVARFRGRCAGCADVVEAGQSACYWPVGEDDASVHHVECAEARTTVAEMADVVLWESERIRRTVAEETADLDYSELLEA